MKGREKMEFFVALGQKLLVADIVLAAISVTLIVNAYRRDSFFLNSTTGGIETGIGIFLWFIWSYCVVTTAVIFGIAAWLTIFH